MEIKIEKGIPITKIAVGHRPKGNVTTALEAMEINDSIFLGGFSSIKASAHSFRVGKNTGRKFAVRAVEGGARIWRVA